MSRLYISLDGSARCKAGSTISGTIELRGDDDINVLSITISMIGRCKTKLVQSSGDTSQALRGRAPLVTQRILLFSGPSTLHPGHSWSFEFTLPYRCTERGQDPFNTRPESARGFFDTDAHQILPPKFSDHHGSGIAFISYELVANLVVDRRWPLSSKEIPTTRVLEFQTTRTVQVPDLQMDWMRRSFICSSLALSPGHEDVRLTFKDKMKSMWNSKLPTARFTLRVTYPRVAIIDQTIPITLGIDHDIDNSTAMAPPMVNLRTFSVALVALTDTQHYSTETPFIPGSDKERPSWATEYPFGSFQSTKKGPPNQVGAPPVDECLDLRNIMKLSLPQGQAPTFSTFNIRRSYKLSFKVMIECAQQQFKAEFLTGGLVLLPATYEPTTANGLAQNLRNELRLDETVGSFAMNTDDSVPPPYT